MFFKRRQEKRWRGAGTVLGKDSNFVLIRHGAQIYRCHPCQLLKRKKDRFEAENSEIPVPVTGHMIDGKQSIPNWDNTRDESEDDEAVAGKDRVVKLESDCVIEFESNNEVIGIDSVTENKQGCEDNSHTHFT